MAPWIAGLQTQATMIGLGLGLFLAFAVVHTGVLYVVRPRRRYNVLKATLAGTFLVGVLLLVALGTYAGPGLRQAVHGGWSIAALTCASLLVAYLNIYGLAERSITTQMLLLIERSPRRAMSYEEMKAAYHVDEILLRRCRELTYGGYLAQRDGAYVVTAKGRAIGYVLGGCQRLIGLGEPGGARG